jgi:hypothetical protein
MTLIGHKTATYIPKPVSLVDPVFFSDSGGKKRYRFAVPQLYLRPGDAVTVGTDTFTAGMVSIMVSGTSRQMEVSEA